MMEKTLSIGAVSGLVVASFGSAAAAQDLEATLEIRDIDITADGNRVFFDLDNDGTDDFRVTDATKVIKDTNLGKTFFSTVGQIAVVNNHAFAGALDLPKATISTSGAILQDTSTGFTTELTPGEAVSAASEAGDSAFLGLTADLFTESNFPVSDTVALGPLANIGDTTYVGLRLEELGEEPVIYYGWAEITRGSLTVSRVGFQTVANAAAPIPGGVVPVPASLALLATGAVGLASLRRRKTAAAR